jgi:hypothetical protein
VANLNWIAANVADELAGAVTAAASYIAHKPEHADALRAAVIDRLDEQERAFIRMLVEDPRKRVGSDG